MTAIRERRGRLDRGDGVELAWAHLPGAGPTVVFLPGFKSDMEGAKALALHDWCARHGRAMLRLDYSGHGASGGSFDHGTIGRWRDDARAVIDAVVSGPLVLVGSSMGGWIGLLLARDLRERVVGFIGIAAAPDFTERLVESFDSTDHADLHSNGHVDRPSQYGPEPYRFTRALIDDGRHQLLLNAPIPIDCPVRLLQGQDDPDVPWLTALRIAERLTGGDVAIHLIKDGDHRLSRPQDLVMLARCLGMLLGEDGA